MGKKLQSELHLLCEESKWPEVISLLNRIIIDDDADDDADDARGRGRSRAAETTAEEKRSSSEGKLKDNKFAPTTRGRQPRHQEEEEDDDHRQEEQRHQRLFSLAPTSTTAPSTNNDFVPPPDAVSSSLRSDDEDEDDDDSDDDHHDDFEEDLRCSYENIVSRSAVGGSIKASLDELDHLAGSSSIASSVRNSSLVSGNNNEDNEQLSKERRSLLLQQLLRREGPHGRTPLLIATVRSAPPVVISKLIAACPKSCKVADKNGNLPVHFVGGWRSRHRLLISERGERGERGDRNSNNNNNIEGKDIRILRPSNNSEEAYDTTTTKHNNNLIIDGSHRSDGTYLDTQSNELCLVSYMLLTTHPTSLTSLNRHKQTPLHTLFEHHHHSNSSSPRNSRKWEGDNTNNNTNNNNNNNSLGQLCLVETFMGMWNSNDNGTATTTNGGNSKSETSKTTNRFNVKKNSRSELHKLFDSYRPPTLKSSNPRVTRGELHSKLQQRLHSSLLRALRTRDSRGKLPLHVASECPWVNESTLRLLSNKFPAACYVPVLPPFENVSASELVVSSSFKSSFKTVSSSIVSSFRSLEDRNEMLKRLAEDLLEGDQEGAAVAAAAAAAAAAEEEEEELEGSDAALFPKTGGCYGRDLAVHLLHKRFLFQQHQQHHRPPSSYPAHSTASTSLNDGETSYGDDGRENWSRGEISHAFTEDASVFLTENHAGAISALLEPLADALSAPNHRRSSEARSACAATGHGAQPSGSFYSAGGPHLSSSVVLPLHIAALHGVSYRLLEGLCRAHPEGAVTPMVSPYLHPSSSSGHGGGHDGDPRFQEMALLPIELFEEGRAGHEVNVASDREFPRLSLEYFRRSDLLFSYFPEAVSSKKVVYCRDEARLGRFEELIRREAQLATKEKEGALSDVAGSVWLFLCRSTSPSSSADPSNRAAKLLSTRGSPTTPNFGAAIGRVLHDLDPPAVRKLHVLRTASNPEGARVPPLGNGRTVVEEARHRSPSGSMARMLEERFFHSSVLCFLEAGDALSYSLMCRKAWTRGVRPLANSSHAGGGREEEGKDGTKSTTTMMESERTWRLMVEDLCHSETSSEEEERGGRISQPWQKLELPYVPSCTHTVFVSCDISYTHNDDGDDANSESKFIIPGEGGGLLILGEEVMTSASRQPNLVAASLPVPPGDVENDNAGAESQTASSKTTRVAFSFNYSNWHSYTLWYYGSEGHTLTISNLSVRQLVYSCDYNGHNPLHVLLLEDDNPRNLKEQMTTLIDVGFGSNLPIHYALKVGVLEKTLRCLVDANPAALLDTDMERRTPLHAAFDNAGKMPYLGVVRALLTQPGVNATHLKDANGKLPIHIAAENGAGEALLRVLVDAYADGCYRRTDDGDLPLHLLVRSGSANPVTVELLIRPIIHNPTICAYPGSVGVHLPLHIAAEYRCKYSILEGLVSSYSEATHIKRQLLQQPQHPPDTSPKSGSDAKNAKQKQQQQQQQQQSTPTTKKEAHYALEIFEEGRGAEEISLEMVKDTVAAAGKGKGDKGSPTQKALGEADFNLRSDLIFVHNPNVPKSIRPYITTYYRDEKDRIERLAAVIKREAMECCRKKKKKRPEGGGGAGGGGGEGGTEEEVAEPKLTEMAQLAWCWMCTNDHYAGVISDIVLSLPLEAVRFLALTQNPKSEPVPDTPIKDCSSPRCALIIKSRLSFLGRYILDRDATPLHKSDSCVILRARDIGAMESYLSIQTLMSDAEPDIDDYSHGCGSVYAIQSNAIEVDRFTHFARKVGLDQAEAISEIHNLLLETSTKSGESLNLKECGVKSSVFAEFCKNHAIDSTGCRTVVIKFMRSRQSFELERQCRDILCESGKSSSVVPILNQFSFKKGEDSNDFTRDMFGEGPLLMNLSRFRYGIVMPCSNGDLRDIFYREGITSSNLRENAKQVGETLHALHEQGITHMNLQLKNVLRFGKQMVLSDFGSALFLKSIKGVNAIGGTSTKICPSILPPEMVAKVELSNREGFDQLMRYWKYVHTDANLLRSLTPHERQAISQFVESCESKSYKKSKEKKSGWKEEISSLLETIQFEDLPAVLSNCTTFDDFCIIWERMCQNYNLWETIVRPRIDEENRCVYMLKTFENRHDSPPRETSMLPYKLVSPSEKVDVWIFGIFIYELCSGGNPFHTGYQGDLRGVDAYSTLYQWDRSAAEKTIREHVQDPLAQDLLCQILVPADERLPSVSEVLKHPFFSPKSVEAERYLEKYEEMQLLRDNTVSVRKVTKQVTQMLDDSMEKYCKLAFAVDQIAFPTCLMVLPYSLDFDESINRPVAAANPRLVSCAVKLGKCLLEINKATARLSFWLMMSGKMRAGDGMQFKSQMQEWLKRARFESCASIAMEIVNGLGCGTNYAMICEEVLAFDGNISKAKSYMRDPIRAARKAFKQNADEISALYQSLSYLYLVDEVSLVPNCASRKNEGTPYPIRFEPNPKLMSTVLLPFMNIVVMKALAKNKFEGLAMLLGLPPSMGIPESWLSTEPGLLHSLENSASIEDFVSLQKIVRKDDHNFLDDASVYSRANLSHQSSRSGMSSAYDNASFVSISALGLETIDLSPGDPRVAAVPMTQLELLFRERDPDREFGKLRRVTSGSLRKSPGLWTNLDTIRQFKSMVEIAELEEELRELKLNLDKTRDAAGQYATLLSRRKQLRKNMPINEMSPLSKTSILDESSFPELTEDNPQSELIENDKCLVPSNNEQYPTPCNNVQFSMPSIPEQSPRPLNRGQSSRSMSRGQSSRSMGREQFGRRSIEHEPQPQDERESDPAKQRSEERHQIPTHRMSQPQPQPRPRMKPKTDPANQSLNIGRNYSSVNSDPINPNSVSKPGPNPKSDEDELNANKKKMRKSKRKFRPWFTAC